MRFAILLAFAVTACAQQAQPCPRPVPGASVRAPAELRSTNGRLEVEFALRTGVDVYGLTLYCYVYDGTIQSPTLRVQRGDEVILRLKNELPPGQATHAHTSTLTVSSCDAGPITPSSTNLHFHGLSLPPSCHQDDAIHTLVQPGSPAFEYRFRIPADHPAGLYWYHPHPHGFTERQVLGGASGALIVEGIERSAPAVAGLPERILILRDQRIGGVAEDAESDGDRPSIPSLDLSLNYVPILYPLYKPATMLVRPKQKEFWRVLNASADTFFNLQLLYWPNRDTQTPQPLQVIALDGVAVGAEVTAVERTSILLPPGARAEFLVTTPPEGMYAQFLTQRYDNGPAGNTDSYRVLANIRSLSDAPAAPGSMPPAPSQRTAFSGLTTLPPARERRLYFSEKVQDPSHPKASTSYFITAGDRTPKMFDMHAGMPDLTTTQGTVEDWVIENRAQESHVFHIHQLHFQLLERDGKPVKESALRDTIDIPYWDGKSQTYPTIKVRLDFRSPDIVGTFLYHCHILEHEDGGMMGSIEVVAPGKR
ncbi:MAG TPA: multicopper oxidase domain-containing protein [Bryobacteraceae bacterium]|nr:multicopper oxidase domain-containing protein [Bryobacteraceae bacterium]